MFFFFLGPDHKAIGQVIDGHLVVTIIVQFKWM